MLNPGTLLGGRYRLDERIAGGGMGDVWRGTDEVLGRTVAVKVLLPQLLEEQGFAERFRGEARTMATINHPGVVDVYDYGNEGDTAFLIMEYVEGDALSSTLGRVGRLTPARTMDLIAQAADALHAAHGKGIVHRDVKPGNLLVRPNGTLVLTDFGIARSAQAANLTAVGSVLGTASYISPEQASGQKATPLSDVYALGIVAYQCLSGRRPFEGENPIEIAMRHVREQAPPLPGDIPPAVAQIVERSMAKDPSARWQTAAALAQAARSVAGQLSAGGTAVLPEQPGSPAGPAGAGGTRMFTGPVSPAGMAAGGPAGPGRTGQFSRGAAGVPAPQPPQRPARGYPGAGQGGGYRDPRGPGGGQGNRNALIAGGSLLAVLLVLLLGVGLYQILASDEDGDGVTPATSTSQDAGDGKMVDIPCDTLIGQSRSVVKTHLEQQGFEVEFTTVESQEPADQVTDINPCQASAGATITVTVSDGKGGSGNGNGGATTESTPSPTDLVPLDPLVEETEDASPDPTHADEDETEDAESESTASTEQP